MSVAPPDRPGLSRRHRVLGVAAVATLAASFWALGEDAEVPPPRGVATPLKLATAARGLPAADAARGPADATAMPATPLALPERYGLAIARLDLFAAPPAAPASAALLPAAAPVALPAPAAPPAPPAISLPFSFAGRLVTAAGPSVLLNEGSTTRVLALGSTLGDFRFEQDSGTQLDFVHLPSGEHLALVLQP